MLEPLFAFVEEGIDPRQELLGGAMADVVVEVEVVTGSGLAYASVLDGSGSYSGTSDPTTILPVTGGSAKVTLLEIGSIQGLNEFSGSASITNYSNGVHYIYYSIGSGLSFFFTSPKRTFTWT